MPIAAVQRRAKGSVGAQPTVTIDGLDGWTTPTLGNLIVVAGSSDGLLSVSPPMTAGPAIVDDNAVYLWWKIADGTESSITVTPSASTDTAIVAAEYSGVVTTSPVDAASTGSITGTSGTATNPAPISLTVAGDLVVAIAGLGRVAGTGDPFPTGLAWSNGFTSRVNANTGSTSGTFPRQYIDLGDLFPGVVGSVSTVATWTNAMFNRQHLIIAFKAGADATSAPAGAATGTGTAEAPAPSAAANAPLASGAGSVPAATASARPAAPLAAATGASLAPRSTVLPAAELAAASGAAFDATVATESATNALAEVAAAAGDASTPAADVAPLAAIAAGTGTAPDAAALTDSTTLAPAEVSAGAGAALPPTFSSTAIAELTAAAGAASDPSSASSAATTVAAGAGSAPDAVALVSYPAYAELATAAGLAPDATVLISAWPTATTADGAAPDAAAETASDVRPFLDVEASTRISSTEPGVLRLHGEPDSRPIVAGARW
jgi:hypothetical protein